MSQADILMPFRIEAGDLPNEVKLHQKLPDTVKGVSWLLTIT